MVRSARLAAATFIGLTMVTGGAVAQVPANPQPSTPQAGAPAPADNTTPKQTGAPTGSLERTEGLLRASELTRAEVFNDHGDSIGTVSELLLDDHGAVKEAIVSVGGFLGIASKFVAIPFNKFHIEQSHVTMKTMDTTRTNPAKPNDPQRYSVFYSLVLPGATKASLEKMENYSL